MKQGHRVSFVAGMAAGAFLLMNVYLYSPELLAIIDSYQEARVPQPPLVFDNRPDPAYDREIVLVMNEFFAFPESRMVLRSGETIIEAPSPRYTDKEYLDIDLTRKAVTLFVQGEPQVMYEVMAYGNPWSSPTPKGEFAIRTKEEKHFSREVGLWMPWAMQVKGDYFLHGWPYYPNGTLYKGKYSRGCVRIPTDQIKELFARIAIGTPVVIY